jgi:hypothetical protein
MKHKVLKEGTELHKEKNQELSVHCDIFVAFVVF